MSALDRLTEIEARAEAGTEGPWEASADGDYVQVVERPATATQRGCPPHRLFTLWSSDEDAEFIAHARNDVPALVSALRAVLAEHRALTVTTGRVVCPVCASIGRDTFRLDATDYPCPTVRAIAAHLDTP